jgi:hypothetical protein
MKTRSLCPGFLLFLAASTVGNDLPNASSIEGFVTLNSASYLAGVKVGVDNRARGTHFEGKTNTSGYYMFEDIRPGAYSIWAEVKGYGCILIPRLAVHYGERVRQDFNFVAGGAHEGCEPVEKKTLH